MKDFAHLLRLAGAAAVALAAFLLVRSLLIPPSYGRIGRYRAAAVDDVKAHAVKYAGRAAADTCAACHAEPVRTKERGPHRGVWCETCHGPAAAHAEDPGGTRPFRPTAAEMRAFCGRCHEDNGSRPKGFPTVNLFAHNPRLPCTACHAAHAPRIS